MSLQGWENLRCLKCQGDGFIQVVQLIYRDNQGTANRPNGFQCASCGISADMAALVAASKAKHLDQQIKDLEGQRA